MQKQMSPALDSTECNCLALRQAARHVSQIYERYLAALTDAKHSASAAPAAAAFNRVRVVIPNSLRRDSDKD